MNSAGFVLAGGRSSRMGRDKALLELDGESLISRVGRRVEAAAGSVTLVGDPERYGRFGLPVVSDLRPGEGPLAGIEAALSSKYAQEWNLIVACDMPNLENALLEILLAEARLSEPDCVAAVTARGMEPLCAVYRRGFLFAAQRSLDAGQRKIRDALAGVRVIHVRTADEEVVANVNTPEDWRNITGAGAAR